MGDVMTRRLLDEREQVETKVRGIETIAVEQKRDLSPADIDSLETYSKRLKEIDGQLEWTTQQTEMDTTVRDRIARVNPEVSSLSYRSAGELLYDVLHQSDKDSRQRYQAVQRRAAEHMGTDAAETVATAGDLGGLVVAPVTGPVIDVVPSGRPFLTAIGVRPAPSAFTFMRPRIVDPNGSTQGVGTQAKQKQELASQAFNVKSDNLELTTVGGYLNVSQQLLSFQPGSLDIIVAQLNKRLALASESAAIDVVTSTTAQQPAVDMADGAAVRKAIFDAAAVVYANTGELPTWIAMGPAGWANLGGLVDLANRPLFPLSAPSNPMGSASPGTFDIVGTGLRGIVTPAITDATLYLGNGVGIEAYEYRYPVLEAVEPSVLGRQVAVASSLVFYQPPTTEADPSGDPAAAYEGIVAIPAA